MRSLAIGSGRQSMADISNISGIQGDNIDKQSYQTKVNSVDAFDKLMQEQITGQTVSNNRNALSKKLQNKTEENFLVDNNCHIDAFIQQAFSQMPESEKRIWNKMKEELDI